MGWTGTVWILLSVQSSTLTSGIAKTGAVSARCRLASIRTVLLSLIWFHGKDLKTELWREGSALGTTGFLFAGDAVGVFGSWPSVHWGSFMAEMRNRFSLVGLFASASWQQKTGRTQSMQLEIFLYVNVSKNPFFKMVTFIYLYFI